MPFVAHDNVAVDNLGGYVSAVAASAKIIFGIAAINANGEPGAVLAKTGQLEASTAAGIRNDAVSANLINGNVYFLLVLNTVAAIQMTGFAANAAVSIVGSSTISGAPPWQYQYSGQTDIPADLTSVSKTAPGSNGNFPRVCFRVA